MDICRKGMWAFLLTGTMLCLSPVFGSKANGAVDEEYSVISRIDQKCFRTRGEFKVPAGKVAQNFHIEQLNQGVGCETGSPIEYKMFAIKNADTDKIVYEYAVNGRGTPEESPVRLSRLILPPGNYLLSVAGGTGAVCALGYQLSAGPEFDAGRKQLRASIDRGCRQQCDRFTVAPQLVAQKFRLAQLAPGVGCGTGMRIDLKSFRIQDVDREQDVFTFRQAQDNDPSQEPVPLDRLVLSPGNYRLCVGGGDGAVCALSYELAGKPDLEPGSISIRSWIDRDCIQHCVAFTVAAFTAAQNFRIGALDQGTNCQTGMRVEMKSFRIQNEITGETDFRYVYYSEQNQVEWPVKLSQLSLGPGNYRMCVSGGKDASCVLEYSIVARPGAVPPAPPPRPPKKPPPPIQEAKPDIKHEISVASDLLVLQLDEVEEQIDRLKESVISIKSLADAEQARKELTRLEAEVKAIAARREMLRKRAAENGIDIEALAGDDWGELEGKPRNFLSSLSLMEDDILERERKLQEQEEEVVDSSTADIEKWVKYAEDFSRRNRVALDIRKLRADMEAKVRQSISSQVTFYQHLLAKYVSCLVEGAQKRTGCRVSGNVISVKVEADKRRVTYEFETVEECPQKTYRFPGKGQTTFEELERWVRDSCSRR